MLFKSRFLGTTLLISGTTIGAGMLALPTVTSFAGFFPSLVLMLICFTFLLLSASLVLEVKLSSEGETNFISLSQKTLGKWGKRLSAILIMLLLYSLTAAYISGSTPIFNNWLSYATNITLNKWLAPWPLITFFGFFVFLGTKAIDFINRFLMLGLFISYALLVVFVPAHVQWSLLSHFDTPATLIALPIVITAFGFHHIIPSITDYMLRDKKKLLRAFIIGTSIPLVVYVLWEFLVLGTVPITGKGLALSWVKGEEATIPLSHFLKNPWIVSAATLFAFFAIVTSFLGVAMGLVDFLLDGLKIRRDRKGRFIALSIAIIPPLIFSYLYQRGFIIALSYAGVILAVLFGIMPILMVRKLKEKIFWHSSKGKIILFIMSLFFFLVIVANILERLGYLNFLIKDYL